MIVRVRSALVALFIALFVARAAWGGPSLGLAANLIAETGAAPAGSFPLVTGESAATLYHNPADYPGVVRAIGDLQADIERVTQRKPAVVAGPPQGANAVVVGTLGRSAEIDALVANGKLDAADLKGRRESFVITTIAAPWPGVERALVIAGSDKRGTIYGIYELSEQLGVSPWYWWADVPARPRAEAHVLPGRYASGEPVVRYRGIFLNDEAPCLTGWAAEKFGGLNSRFYTRVFELLLRLRANYLWPAMWDNAFNEDDPDNPRLADEYGIIMGTSHHEPMMRAHKEWTRRREQYGNGQWNYATNGEALRRFFREGIARNRAYENLVTIGMRGDGDERMASTGSIASDLQLLERVMADQRRILAEELKTAPDTVPQLWALFTEVQKFYEAGLRPPDDVTLLWTDDNTGNLRRLPTAEERRRRGGAGIYYHLDMHGGPFAYQWINTNPLPKIAEQMNLAYEYGATRIWIANVGDLKPLEVPTEFFLRLAWNPAALGRDQVAGYTRRWAEREFGPAQAGEIADLVARYAKYNGWRKPELVTPDTFSPLHYREAERVEAAWDELVARAEAVQRQLPPAQQAAYFQLVFHPIKASALVARMNILAGRNRLFAKQGRASTNDLAAEVRALFRADRALSDQYNHELAGGKWNHLMDQTHLGQFSWEPPVADTMPAVTELLPPDAARFGVAVEGDVESWPGHFGPAVLPLFDSFQPRRSYLEVFARGTKPVDVTVTAERPWIRVTEDRALRADRRFWVDIDWSRAPDGRTGGAITVRSGTTAVSVQAITVKATPAELAAARGRFASLAGPIAIEAGAARRTAAAGVRWDGIPDYGRGDGAVGLYPVTAASILPPAAAPRLEYPLYLPHPGLYEVKLVLGPVMDFVPTRGMRIAVAVDDQAPQILDLFANREAETFLGRGWWEQFTRDNARFLRATVNVGRAGAHRLTVAMVDPGPVLQQVIISDGNLPPSYFGPPPAAPVE